MESEASETFRRRYVTLMNQIGVLGLTMAICIPAIDRAPVDIDVHPLVSPHIDEVETGGR